MKISSCDSEQIKEHSGYDHSEDADVSEFVMEDEALHEPSYKSGEQNLALVVSDLPLNYSASSKKVRSRRSAHNPIGAKTRAMIQAEEVQSSLGTKFPTFIKYLVRSHVSSCYWLGLPNQFCKSHLPKKDTFMTVETESRERFQVKYLPHKIGLSGGWRSFAIAQKLVEGDVMVFQLVKFDKFKVYRIRDNDLNKADGVLSIANIDAREHENDTGSVKHCKRKRSKSIRLGNIQRNKKTGPNISVAKTLQLANVIKNSDTETDLDIITCPSFSSSQVEFKDVKSFKGFTIIVDDLCIDSEVPNHIRVKYYALCSEKQSFLHASLMQGLNSKLVAGIICEIVSISDSLKQCSLTTCHSEFSSWDKALKSFEDLGMDVGFLRFRIQKLVDLAFESEEAIMTRKYMEAKLGLVRAEDDMITAGSNLMELEAAYKKHAGNVKTLKSQAESYERKFREEVDAPW